MDKKGRRFVWFNTGVYEGGWFAGFLRQAGGLFEIREAQKRC